VGIPSCGNLGRQRSRQAMTSCCCVISKHLNDGSTGAAAVMCAIHCGHTQLCDIGEAAQQTGNDKLLLRYEQALGRRQHRRSSSCVQHTAGIPSCKECSGTGRRINASKADKLPPFAHVAGDSAHANSTGSCTRNCPHHWYALLLMNPDAPQVASEPIQKSFRGADPSAVQ
jgi:hypothetical protein